MRRTLVRYTVKPGSAELNAELVRAVYRELTALRPVGFRYVTYRLEDGRTFVHIAEQEGDGEGPLPELASFQEFREGLADRCERGPVVGEAEEVGRFDS